jgi:hypothetical protein
MNWNVIQCQPIIPTRREIPNLDLLVAGSLPLTPEQEALFSTQPLLVDIADGKPENQSPYQTQYDLAIAVNYVFSTNICHLYAAPLDEIQPFVDILESLDPQLRFGGISSKRLVTKDF